MRYCKLKTITEVVTCGVAKRPEYVDDGIKFLSSQNIKADKVILSKYNMISREDYEKLTKINKPEKGDVLYTRVGSFGEAAIADIDEDFAIYVSLTLIKPKKDIINNRYLMHYLNSPVIRDLAKRSTRGIGVQNLNVDTVREFDIYVPTMDKQCTIVSILDKAHNLIDKRKEQIKFLDELVKSKFIEMFGDPVLNQKGWDEINLGNLFVGDVDYRGKTPPKSSKGIPLISAANVKMGKVDLSNADYISEDDYENWLKRGIPNTNDILITTEAPMGRVALYPEGLYQLSRRVIAFEPDKLRLNSQFALYTISSESWQKRLYKKVRGSTVPRILKPDLLAEPIQVPPIELQNKFADFVNQVDKLKKEMKNSLKELEDNFNSLMQRAFKGELF